MSTIFITNHSCRHRKYDISFSSNAMFFAMTPVATFEKKLMSNSGYIKEKMLSFLEIKYRYMKQLRPQANQKMERFWRALEDAAR